MRTDTIITTLTELSKINDAYGIENDGIKRLQVEILNAKVCTPVIGKFSTGKSSLINTLLGYSRKLLREDITPETAIPAEIMYTDAEDEVVIVKNDGTFTIMETEDYRTYEADASTVKKAQIKLKNRFLEVIPDVMLVDMPGFESGFEIHNRAIDDYLPHSLAYIVTFSADDMIVRSSVGNILKELNLNAMPLCVVITKYDKRNDEFEETFSKMKESLKRFVGDSDITYCITSSFSGEAEELKRFLMEIQERSQDILSSKYKSVAYAQLENTEHYLMASLHGNKLSESDLDEREESIKEQLGRMNDKFEKERSIFEDEIVDSVIEIKSDIRNALNAEESTFVNMCMNNQNINDHLNSLVRNTVTLSVKKRFIPKVEKYLKKVERVINSDEMGDFSFYFSMDSNNASKGIIGGVVAGSTVALLGLPLLGALVGFIIGFLRNKRRKEAKQAITQKLRTEVFPQVVDEVGRNIEKTLKQQMEIINESIEKDLHDQRATLEKAMDDIRKQMNDEKKKKENLETDIKNDLTRIEELKYELQ